MFHEAQYTYPAVAEDSCSGCSTQNPSAYCSSLASSKPNQRWRHYIPLTELFQILDSLFGIHRSHSIRSPIPLQSVHLITT